MMTKTVTPRRKRDPSLHVNGEEVRLFEMESKPLFVARLVFGNTNNLFEVNDGRDPTIIYSLRFPEGGSKQRSSNNDGENGHG